jgi:hypothetical protein
MHFRHETGDLIACIIFSGRQHSAVAAMEVHDLDDFTPCNQFKFRTMFNKIRSVPMRKEALKLAKKISQKEVYDVMHS